MKKRMKEFFTCLSLAIFMFSTTCYADVVDPPVVEEQGFGAIMIVAGILVVLVVVIAIICIRKLIRKKKEKDNDKIH